MGEDQDTAQDRVTIQEAARRLGVKEDAIRKRIQRGSMRHEKAKDGRVYVWVDATQDATQETERTSQDTYQDTPQDERLGGLREQVSYLRRQLDEEREARRRADTIIAQLARANEEQARTIRELEAPSEPQRAAPHSATVVAQEGTERPQQRSGWLAPVDKLPWWHYVVGIIAVYLATFFPSAAYFTAIIRGGYYHPIPLLPLWVILLGAAGAVTGAFGFWVGFRQRITRFWPQITFIGAVVGAVAWLGDIAYLVGVRGILRATYPVDPIIAILGGLYALPAWLLYASGLLIGNAGQRRRTGRISGTTPASPVSRATQGATQPRKDMTPAQQAMLGWGGAIISALITLVGTLITVRNGR